MTASAVSGPEVEVHDEPAALYRFYDAGGTLLYVGISRNLAARWGQHETEKSWWPLVVRKTIVMYGSRMEAEIAEGIAIRTESPVHNKAMGRRDPAAIPARKTASPRKPATAKEPPPRLPLQRNTTYGLAPYHHFIEDYARRQGCSDVEAVAHFIFAGIIQDYLDRFEDSQEALDTLKADCELHVKPTAAKRR